jgi:DNA-binding response OmpR family regulator
MRLRPAFAEAPTTVAGKTSLRLAFFQAGADECLMLNQDVAECLARIKAVLRRTTANSTEELIKTGPIELNLTSYTLHVSGKAVLLTSKELDLLYVFLSSPNRVLSRPYLIERVWGYNYFGSPRTVDVHVRRLREKLGKAADLIHTIPCVGYKLVPPGGEMRR